MAKSIQVFEGDGVKHHDRCKTTFTVSDTAVKALATLLDRLVQNTLDYSSLNALSDYWCSLPSSTLTKRQAEKLLDLISRCPASILATIGIYHELDELYNDLRRALHDWQS